MTDPEARAMTDQPAAPTPGSWTLETVETSCGICHKIGPFPWTDTEKNHACIYVDNRMAWKYGPELEANARLIAAAPATAAERDRLKVVNEGLVKALEAAVPILEHGAREEAVFNSMLVTLRKPKITMEKQVLIQARAALDEARKP